MGYFYLAVAFILNASANVLLKMAGSGIDETKPLVPQLMWSPVLLGGLVLFALNVLAYFLALRALPLSVAYPVMVGMTFLLVTTASLILFRENISSMQFVGYAFIIIGVVLAAAH